MEIPFVGESYVFPSIAFDYQRAINLYPASSETQTSKSKKILVHTPGRVVFATLPIESIRGFYYMVTTGRLFAVAYNWFIEIFADGSVNVIDDTIIVTTSGYVSISDNGTQVIIVDGTTTGGFIFDTSANTFTAITAMGFLGGVTVTYLNGYFVINNPGTSIYQISAFNDGTMWDSLQFNDATGSPDLLVGIVTLNLQTYLMGQSCIEVVYDSGGDPTNVNAFPLSLVQGVFLQYGTTSAFALVQTANTILFLGRDKDGVSVVWAIENYLPVRVSTQAIEYYIGQYDLTNATGFSYQEDGHYFVQFNIPGAPTSVVYDLSEKQWHERARWNPNSAQYERDRANFHCYAFGMHLVADYENGNIYQQSLSLMMDDTFIMKRTRIMPYIVDDLEYLYFKQFQIDCQTGVGIQVGNTYDKDPQMALSWSDDGGNVWSNQHLASMGAIGRYNTRVIWRRLGRSRFRIFRLDITANIPVYLIAAHAIFEKGYA